MASTVLQPVPDHIGKIILGAFPFPSVQNNQDKIIWAIMRAYASGKKFVVLEAGTGIGKSVLGATAGRIISDDINHQRAKRALELGAECTPMSPTVITKTRVLQKQYEDSFKSTEMDVAILWGKAHYSDLGGDDDRPGNDEQDIHKCAKNCPGMSYEHSTLDCPWLIAFRDYLKPTTVGVTNNAMYMSAPVFRSMTNVLVADECHKLPDILLERSTLELSSRRLLRIMENHEIPDRAYMEACVAYERDNLKEGRIPLRVILQHINNVAGYALTSIIPHLQQLREGIISAAPVYTKKVDKLVKRIDRAITSVDNVIEKINLVLGSAEADEVTWICWKTVEKEEDDEIHTIKVRPLSPLPWTTEELMGGVGFTILMSATVGDYRQYCKDLHLKPEQGEFICVPTPFPAENRKVLDMGIAGMNYSNRLDLLSEDGDFTRAIIRTAEKHVGERGLIHSVSYANAKIIKERLERLGRQVIIPKSGTVIDRAYLSQFKSDCIMVSPSMAEGVDLKDDLCRWQIILKVPYPSLADLWIKAKLQSDEAWYSNQAVMDVLQMQGRGVRHGEDYCTTYVLDSNFRRLVFPDWFNEALVTI